MGIYHLPTKQTGADRRSHRASTVGSRVGAAGLGSRIGSGVRMRGRVGMELGSLQETPRIRRQCQLECAARQWSHLATVGLA